MNNVNLEVFRNIIVTENRFINSGFSVNAGGVIACASKVPYGSDCEVSLTPDADMYIGEVIVNGSVLSAPDLSSFTVENVEDDINVEITWLPYMVDFSDGNQQFFALLENNLSLPISENQCPKVIVKSISQIYWAESGLNELPESFGAFTGLTHLMLNYNSLNSLPSSFVNLVNLRVLNLAQNSFSSVPEVLTSLTQLSYLGLERNALATVPDSLSKLDRLSTLRLGDNSFTHVPDVVMQLTSLTSLDLERN